MNSVSVSKRYKVLLIFLVQLISSASFAVNGEVKIFGFVSMTIDRPDYIVRKLDNLAPPSGAIMARLNGFLDSQNAVSDFEKMSAVNSWVNEQIEFTNDQDDVWKNANQTFAAGAGDCEDHAITKMQLLKNAGFKDDQLIYVIVNDLVIRQVHAVLVVEIDGEYFVLDNITDNLLSHDKFKGIFFAEFAFTSKKAWTFGRQKIQ